MDSDATQARGDPDGSPTDEFGDLVHERPQAVSRAARIGYIAAVVPLALAGLAGLVLPIVPGVALLFLALLLLARVHPKVHHLVNALDRRLPRFVRRFLRLGRKQRSASQPSSDDSRPSTPAATLP